MGRWSRLGLAGWPVPARVMTRGAQGADVQGAQGADARGADARGTDCARGERGRAHMLGDQDSRRAHRFRGGSGEDSVCQQDWLAASEKLPPQHYQTDEWCLVCVWCAYLVCVCLSRVAVQQTATGHTAEPCPWFPHEIVILRVVSNHDSDSLASCES